MNDIKRVTGGGDDFTKALKAAYSEVFNPVSTEAWNAWKRRVNAYYGKRVFDVPEPAKPADKP